MALTLQQFLTTVQSSGLLGRARLDSSLRELGGSGTPIDAPTFARALVKQGLLTEWQSGKLLEGVQQGFFLGKHKLLRHVASGGMSSVYEAEHLLLHRRVALKVLPKNLVGESSYLERFYREARAVAQLNHPNIIRGFDVGQDGDHHYFAMEFVEGTNLQDLVDRSGPVPYRRAVEMIRQAALGLGHAHEAGLVHRDIKPGNLLLDRDGTVKILDLGLVRSLPDDEDEEASLTRVHDESVLGTVDYLSPEQAIDSHDVDIRSDLYSLGCTLYFLLTGGPPYPKGTMAERLLAHQTKTPVPPSVLRPEIPESLNRIVARMMARRPEARFQNPQEVSDLLGDWLFGEVDPGKVRAAGKAPAPEIPVRTAPVARESATESPDSVIIRRKRRTAASLPSAMARAKVVPEKSHGRLRVRPKIPANSAFQECWIRWAKVFEVVAARREPRLPFGEASYHLIHENLLIACREGAESSDAQTLEFLELVEDFVAPWLNLDSLRSIVRSEMKASLVARYREFDRIVRPHRELSPQGRLLLRVCASLVVVITIGSVVPVSSMVSAAGKASRTLVISTRRITNEFNTLSDSLRRMR
ncbi:serine/threonine-protein kinase [Tundrisphaera lichenicola]|uniref:serine/threonine-protein kinase n=1 Tax=Tundrisphaera lichenicola TaxID=2029860 RepID=UPI003EC00723